MLRSLPRPLTLSASLLLAAGCKDDAPQPDDSSAVETGVDSVDDTDSPDPEGCPTTFTYPAQGAADAVFIAGPFNEWSPDATPLDDQGGGLYSVTLDLPPGAWPYKLIEVRYTDSGREQSWTCDPGADFAQCDEGYDWAPSCAPGASACNSLRVVADCDQPTASVEALSIDRGANAIRLTPAFTPAQDDAPLRTVRVTLDGALVDERSDLSEIVLEGLSDGRHTVRVELTDASGRSAEPLYVPAWLDDRRWETGLLYWVFVDRFADGDPSRNTPEGTSDAITDYLGGDWQGVRDRLDYLESLGVTALWITAPQDNPAGAWGDKCGADFSGYHGYWPADPTRVEEHFGAEADFRALVDDAHARGMRVLVDWVANHVHSDHPYYAAHPEWFNDLLICQGDVWNTDPEVCWFDSFLPDIRYYEPEPLVRMVDDAVGWIKDYELDGYRVDAVKHMPHSVFFNLQSRIRREVEHGDVGGDEPFYTVGETYTGDRGLIGAYVNDRELDAQFDFPLYWAILSTFARGETSLRDLEAAFAESEAAFDGALMSTFLGNHDVERFVAHAEGEVVSLYGDGPCGGDGALRSADSPPTSFEPYQRLMLAWTWLLTHEGLPLIYYGDEIGLEGYGDPDNRHMMRFEGALSTNEAAVLAHVRSLGQARQAHPAMAVGARAEWWIEDDVSAWARVSEGDEVLAIVNRSGVDRTLTNGLAFAGLSPDAAWLDVLSGQRLQASGDSLTVTVPALGSVVLVKE
ncbi:MAG: hypothetical protein H6739_07005 [Alphaproteobacteria bacterium]|nr:hypothetical protein [Alphaproteobacteria bacterium]